MAASLGRPRKRGAQYVPFFSDDGDDVMRYRPSPATDDAMTWEQRRQYYSDNDDDDDTYDDDDDSDDALDLMSSFSDDDDDVISRLRQLAEVEEKAKQERRWRSFLESAYESYVLDKLAK